MITVTRAIYTDALDARNFGYPAGMSTNGGTFDATLAFGAGFDDGRGHVTAYVGYRKINAVTQASRDYSACSLSANTTASVAAGGRAIQLRWFGNLTAGHGFCV